MTLHVPFSKVLCPRAHARAAPLNKLGDDALLLLNAVFGAGLLGGRTSTLDRALAAPSLEPARNAESVVHRAADHGEPVSAAQHTGLRTPRCGAPPVQRASYHAPRGEDHLRPHRLDVSSPFRQGAQAGARELGDGQPPLWRICADEDQATTAKGQVWGEEVATLYNRM